MFRALILVLAAVFGGQALAASEADKQSCAASQSPDARIEACTRVLADQGVPDALRVLAYRGRGTAYSAKRVFALAVLDFDEALKISRKSGSLPLMVFCVIQGGKAFFFLVNRRRQRGQRLQINPSLEQLGPRLRKPQLNFFRRQPSNRVLDLVLKMLGD